MADLDKRTVNNKDDGQCSASEAEAHVEDAEDNSEPCTVAVGALSSRRPRAEIEAQIDAAIESRREQIQILDTRNVPVVGDSTPTPAAVGDFEYLDHTADVQLHSWGTSLERALESLVLAMFGYMTDLNGIELQQEQCVRIQGHDATSMVFLFLQEWLTLFHETGFVPRKVSVIALIRNDWKIVATGHGNKFDSSRNTQGTEIKAVTYSNLQVREPPNKDRCDIWVIVDI